MIWADRVALLAAVPMTLFAAFMVLGENAQIRDLASIGIRSGLVQHSFVETWTDMAIMTVLPLWLALRAVDLILGGPRWRRKSRVEIIPPQH